jgi:hypothetical protein
MENQWLGPVAVASLLPAVDVGKEHSCIAASAVAAAAAIGNVGDCPSTAVEDGVAVL